MKKNGKKRATITIIRGRTVKKLAGPLGAFREGLGSSLAEFSHGQGVKTGLHFLSNHIAESK